MLLLGEEQECLSLGSGVVDRKVKREAEAECEFQLQLELGTTGGLGEAAASESFVAVSLGGSLSLIVKRFLEKPPFPRPV